MKIFQKYWETSITNYGGISMKRVFLVFAGVIILAMSVFADIRGEQDAFIKVAEKVMPAVVKACY